VLFHYSKDAIATRVYLDTRIPPVTPLPISRIVFDTIIAIASRQYCNPLGSKNTICAINKETVKAETSLRCEAGFKTTRMFRGKKQCCWMVLSLAFRLSRLAFLPSQPVILCLLNIRRCR